MADPNSLLSIVRRALVSVIAPKPDLGEAWCVDCSFNEGKTMVIPADSAVDHAKWHSFIEPGKSIVINARFFDT